MKKLFELIDDFHTLVSAAAIGIVIGGAVSFYAAIASTVFGGLGGWAVGYLFGTIITDVLAKLGITGVEMRQFGCFLGFVGGFFKSSQTCKCKND